MDQELRSAEHTGDPRVRILRCRSNLCCAHSEGSVINAPPVIAVVERVNMRSSMGYVRDRGQLDTVYFRGGETMELRIHVHLDGFDSQEFLNYVRRMLNAELPGAPG